MQSALIAIEDEPVGVIEKIHFAPGVEEGDRTFFLHAMFLKFWNAFKSNKKTDGKPPPPKPKF